MYASVKKLWWLLSPRDRRNAIFLTLLLLFNGLLEMVGVGIIPAYVGIVAYPDKLMQNRYVQEIFSSPDRLVSQEVLLYWGSALFLLFFTLKHIFTVAMGYWSIRFIQNRVLNLGDRLFTAYMRAPYTFHLDRNSAQLLRNVSVECGHLGSSVLNPLVQLGTQIFVLVTIAALLVAASPGFAVLSLLLFIAAAGAISGVIHKKVERLGREAQSARAEVTRSVNEGLGGVKEVKILQRERSFIDRYRSLSAGLLRSRDSCR